MVCTITVGLIEASGTAWLRKGLSEYPLNTNQSNRSSAFKTACRLVSMKHEYPGYTGLEKWLLVSSLSEAEVMERFADEVKPYTPFIYMSRESFSPIAESQNNQRKHEIRSAKYRDAYAYEDGLTEVFHSERLYDPLSEHTSRMFLHEILDQLTPTQRERIWKRWAAYARSSQTLPDTSSGTARAGSSTPKDR